MERSSRLDSVSEAKPSSTLKRELGLRDVTLFAVT
jgi:hypothetical protein